MTSTIPLPARRIVEVLLDDGFRRQDPLALVLAPRIGAAIAYRSRRSPHPAPGRLPAPSRHGADVGTDGAAGGAPRGAAGPGRVAAGPARFVLPAAALDDLAHGLAAIESALMPRWVWWSARGTMTGPLAAGLRVAACWDLAAVHRVLHGGRRDDPAAVWAAASDLPLPPPARRPNGPGAGYGVLSGQLDLWSTAPREPGASTGPLDDDGHLGAGWAAMLTAPPGPGAGERPAADAAPGGWRAGSPSYANDPAEALDRAAVLAALALTARDRQDRQLARIPDARARPGRIPLPVLTARAESAAELLARELERDGLPVDRAAAAMRITELVGPAPRTDAELAASRRRRDTAVIAHLREPIDLRNPAAVRAALRTVGIDVPDTRSGRLEPLRGAHPVVEALLAWRRTERIATTYGHRWLDTYVAADGRLRGAWQGSDGGAGRMTAQAGLHNLPADLRDTVVAEPGRLFVRADLGQIEPRVLAVVSADPALARATAADDMYAPVAAHLGASRADAKIAMLAAMYGQTSGSAGTALRQMRRAYPQALAFLDAADTAGRSGRDLRTYGGRLLRLAAEAGRAGDGAPRPGPGGGLTDPDVPDDPASAGRPTGSPVDGAPGGIPETARGRFARNAVIQGAAAELFKAWAVTVRAGLTELDGDVVLCLHDELLLQVPRARAEAGVELLHRALASVAAYWAAGSGVRFVADVSVLRRWSDAPH